jgi:hypothetical protein
VSEVHDVVRQPAVRERTNVSVASFGAKFMPFTVMDAEAKEDRSEGGVLTGATNVLTGESKVSPLNLPVPTTELTVTA